MAISNIVDIIRMSDVSEVEGGGNIKAGPRALRTAPRLQIEEDPDEATQNELSQLSPDEVNERVKMSTAVFRDWVPEFIGRVLLLFSNLPEEGGKTGRAGGKSEAMTLASVLVSDLPPGLPCPILIGSSTPVEVSLRPLTTSYSMLPWSRYSNTPPRHVRRAPLMQSGSSSEISPLPEV